VANFVGHIEGGSWTEGVRVKGAQEDIWTLKGRVYGGVGKTT